MGYSPWGRKESDTTEQLHFRFQGCMLSPCLRNLFIYFFCLRNLYAEYVMRNAGLDDTQVGIMIARRNINNLRYADDTTLPCRKQGRTNEPLDENQRGE